MRLKGLLVFLALALLLTACSKKTENPTILDDLYGDEDVTREVPPVPEGADEIDENLYDIALKDTYLEIPFRASVTASPWRFPQELDPTCFVNFFLYSHADATSDYGDGVPANELESFVKEYFDVPQDHLRSSSAYMADQHAYSLDEPGGGGAVIKVVDAVQSPGRLRLTYHVKSDHEASEQVLWCGAITIETDSEGGFRYISNEVWNDPADLEISLDGDFTLLLTSAKPMDQTSYIDFAECPDNRHILCGYQQADGAYVVERFQLSGGKSVHQTVLSGISFGRLLRIAKPAHSDFDFYFFFERLIVQADCDSDDHDLLDLPAAMWPQDQPDAPQYDFDGRSWAWTDEEGLWLLSQATGEQRQLFATSDLREQFSQFGADTLPVEPRLICGGEKVACTLSSDGSATGVVVCDLTSGAVEVHPASGTGSSSPTADRYLTTSRLENSVRVLDTLTGEIRQLDHPGEFVTADYETLITWRYDGEPHENFSSYVSTADNPADISRPLLSGPGDQGMVAVAATERYAIYKCVHLESFSIRIARYI